ncbi:MAG: spheroidene monooxygenase [Marinoscillum sp.]
MGTGKGNGFNPWPDFSTYAIVQVWENEQYAHQFFEDATILERYKRHSAERWIVLMKNIVAKGKWSGARPFTASDSLHPDNPYLAIITRATIRKTKLGKFWRYVPTSHRPLADNPGLIYTKGIGEVPVLQMATFSLWENEEALKAFAYQSKEHTKAIQMTRELNWYSEELFARFQPFASYGTWEGENPISDLAH